MSDQHVHRWKVERRSSAGVYPALCGGCGEARGFPVEPRERYRAVLTRARNRGAELGLRRSTG